MQGKPQTSQPYPVNDHNQQIIRYSQLELHFGNLLRIMDVMYDQLNGTLMSHVRLVYLLFLKNHQESYQQNTIFPQTIRLAGKNLYPSPAYLQSQRIVQPCLHNEQRLIHLLVWQFLRFQLLDFFHRNLD